MNLASNASSTPTNNQNNRVLEEVFNHKTDSTKSVNKKYSKPMAKNRMAPLSNSLV